MQDTINKLRRSFALRGILGTLVMCAVGLKGALSPTARRYEAMRREADVAFDAEMGVETGGIFRPNENEVRGKHWKYGIRYQPVNAALLRSVLQQIKIAYPDFTFVDLGSGKGRALLVAASLPFRKIIGVEYCATLNGIAQENVARRPVTEDGCNQFELIHADAAEFDFPDDNLLLYLYNPFGRPVMDRVVQNVTASFRQKPRRIIVIYFTPYESESWQKAGIFTLLQQSPAIFDTHPV